MIFPSRLSPHIALKAFVEQCSWKTIVKWSFYQWFFSVQRIRSKVIAMGRTVKTNGLPQNTQNMDTSNHSDEPKAAKYCLKSLINAVIYAICIISLGLSLYLNYRQSLIEDNIKNLLYLDNKVIRIETDLDDLIRKSNIFYTQINQNRSKQTAVEEDAEGLPPVDVVGKLSLNVFSDLHRLKRDVSTLKMARKQRQTAIQQSSPNECACPAGKCKQITTNRFFGYRGKWQGSRI